VQDIIEGPGGLVLISELARLKIDDRAVRVAHSRGQVQRIRRGAYSTSDALDDDAAYDLRIAAVLATRRSAVTLSHYSAARVWRLPIVHRWPAEVHITESPQTSRRTKNKVVVHRHQLHEGDEIQLEAGRVTSVTRTILDVARIAPFVDAVALTDAALRAELTTKAELREVLGRCGAIDGRGRAARAIDFASPLAQLPGESFSRALIHQLGFPAPMLQHPLDTRSGRRFADFWWEDIRLIGEFDGRGKYEDAQYTGGRDAAAVYWEEKLRENELRDYRTTLTRWTWGDLVAVAPFVRRLEGAGLKRSARARFGG
jgi:hypothetical protein